MDWPPRKNGSLRKCLATFLILTLVIMFIYYRHFNIYEKEEAIILSYTKTRPNVEAEKYLINTSKCRILNEDPFNKEAKKFFHREKYLPCTNKPLLTYIEKKDSLVTLNINQSLLDMYSVLRISCCYAYVTRIVTSKGSDDDVRISDCVPFEYSVNVTSPIVKVKCGTSVNSEIYSNVHAVINHQQVKKKQKDRTNGETHHSVLFVGIDSVSRMNLVRTMPKTYKFLEAHDFVNLKGYTKIGDNTFPNLMAILTGRNWTQVYDYCHPSKNKMNNCDIIWEKFRDLGYITAYAEDESSIGTFNYGRQGFGDPPTDFYFRPYMIAAEKLPSIKRFGMHTCSGPESS